MKRGHQNEIERLYRAMYPKLLEYADSVLDNRALAEEVVQETFVIACRKADELCASPSPEGWLFLALKYTISNTLRMQSTARRILSQYLALNAEGIAVSEDRVGIEITYGDMVEMEEFQLLKDFAIEGKTYLQMSRERGITLPACRKRVQRAKEILRTKIKI